MKKILYAIIFVLSITSISAFTLLNIHTSGNDAQDCGINYYVQGINVSNGVNLTCIQLPVGNTTIINQTIQINTTINQTFITNTTINQSFITNNTINQNTNYTVKSVNSPIFINGVTQVVENGSLELNFSMTQANSLTGGFLTASNFQYFDSKLNATDQRYNDTALINTRGNISGSGTANQICIFNNSNNISGSNDFVTAKVGAFNNLIANSGGIFSNTSSTGQDTAKVGTMVDDGGAMYFDSDNVSDVIVTERAFGMCISPNTQLSVCYGIAGGTETHLYDSLIQIDTGNLNVGGKITTSGIQSTKNSRFDDASQNFTVYQKAIFYSNTTMNDTNITRKLDVNGTSINQILTLIPIYNTTEINDNKSQGVQIAILNTTQIADNQSLNTKINTKCDNSTSAVCVLARENITTQLMVNGSNGINQDTTLTIQLSSGSCARLIFKLGVLTSYTTGVCI